MLFDDDIILFIELFVIKWQRDNDMFFMSLDNVHMYRYAINCLPAWAPYKTWVVMCGERSLKVSCTTGH